MLAGLCAALAPEHAHAQGHRRARRRPATAQPVIEQPVIGPPAAAQPTPVAPPETFGNLVGRRAFYGRFSLGLGADFFHVTDAEAEQTVSLTSGVALHTEGSLGIRFAMVHALAIDFVSDLGITPSLDDTRLEDWTLHTVAIGLGYTNFFRGTGLYFGAGVGVGVARLEPPDDFDSDESYPTGLGFAAHGRIGYDWTLRPRAHLGADFTLRYLGLADELDEVWRGTAITASGSFGWY